MSIERGPSDMSAIEHVLHRHLFVASFYQQGAKGIEHRLT
jgi:hypothetical protein